MLGGEIREPTAEEKARIAAGRRYDPTKPRAPWGERGEELPLPQRKERKYEPLPGFGWEFPWGTDWEKALKFPMQALMGERPWETWTPPYQAPPEAPPTFALEQVVPGQAAFEGAFWATPAYQAMRQAYLYEQSPAGQMAKAMRLEKPVAIPTGVENWSPDEQLAWASENALASRFTDEAGNIISFQEAERLMQEEPDRVITQVWYFGGDATIDTQFYAGDLYNVGFGPAVGFYPGGGKGLAKQKYDPPELLAMKRGILTSNMTYDEKLKALLGLLPSGGTREGYIRILNEVQASLTPEEREEVRARAEPRGEVARAKPEAPEAEIEAPLDVAELGRSIAPYGVNIIQNYPYISPITEAHLKRIPTDILEMMARYLEEKGLSWRDYLELGRVYAGQAPARATWESARQW